MPLAAWVLPHLLIPKQPLGSLGDPKKLRENKTVLMAYHGAWGDGFGGSKREVFIVFWGKMFSAFSEEKSVNFSFVCHMFFVAISARALESYRRVERTWMILVALGQLRSDFYRLPSGIVEICRNHLTSW